MAVSTKPTWRMPGRFLRKPRVILTSTDSGSPDLGRVPVTGFPIHATDRYLDMLRQTTAVAVVDGPDAVVVHPQVRPEAVAESLPAPEPPVLKALKALRLEIPPDLFKKSKPPYFPWKLFKAALRELP
jgi:hypothetical protein